MPCKFIYVIDPQVTAEGMKSISLLRTFAIALKCKYQLYLIKKCPFTVADPGFPMGVPTNNTANFSRKLHENEKNWAMKGARPCTSLRPKSATVFPLFTLKSVQLMIFKYFVAPLKVALK